MLVVAGVRQGKNHCGAGQQETVPTGVSSTGSLAGLGWSLGNSFPRAQLCLYCGFEMFLLLNVLSFFLPACLPFGPLAV